MLLEFSNMYLVRPLVLLLCLLVTHPLSADDEPESASDAKPKTLKVTGVFESLDAREIVPDTEHFAALKLKRIVNHGTKVSQGQNVVWFDTEEIDKKLKDAEIDLRLSKLTLDDDEFAYQQFLETQKLDRAAAERARKNAQQDYDNFVQIDRDRQRVTAEQNLKSSRVSLENAQEELKQLEQMYKEDDLTEESEEIVLKRAKQAVEFAEYRLEGTKISSDREVKQAIPRAEATQENTLARAQLTYQKAIRDLNSARQKQDIEIARKRDKYKDEEKKLAEMRAERKRSVLQSPIAGIFVHGNLTRGKLSDKPSTLKVGSAVTGTQVVATVVDPGKLQIRLDLQEAQLKTVARGAKCKLTPQAFPDHTLAGVVKSVSMVPYAGSKYDAVVTFRAHKEVAVLPMMVCDVVFELPDQDQGGSPEQKPAKQKPAKQKPAKQNDNGKEQQ